MSENNNNLDLNNPYIDLLNKIESEIETKIDEIFNDSFFF